MVNALALPLQLADSAQVFVSPRNDYDRMLRKYYNLNLSQINFSQIFYEVLQVARNNKIRLPGNLGYKTSSQLEGGVTRKFNPEVNLLDEIKPLITELFRRRSYLVTLQSVELPLISKPFLTISPVKLSYC